MVNLYVAAVMPADNKNIVHMVSAWAAQNHIVSGQVKADEKSNEITAIPRLLDLLVLKSCIVTIDTMGCQKETASKMIEKEADYLLALKGNLLERVEDSFRFLSTCDIDKQLDTGHSRVETRRCAVVSDLSMIEAKQEWDSLNCPVKIESERYLKSTGKTEKETRFYISILPADAKLINRSVRAHWRVENSLVDVGFNEDTGRKRTGFAAQNYSLLIRIALNLLKNDKTTIVGIRWKRLKAVWDNRFLINLIKN